MVSERNRHGLSRYIPAPVSLEVRQRCGFGCVICGLAWYDYEHFDPDFKDATEHRADGITLLCMQCHAKRSRGVLSVESVREANKRPRCLQQGFASETFNFAQTPIEVAFAGVTFTDVAKLIVINNYSILSVRPAEAFLGPYRLSGIFADDTGATTLKIEDNVWSVGADSWDIDCEGPRIKIRNGPGDIALVLKAEPPTRLVVERLNMQFNGHFLRGDANLLEISQDGQHWMKFQSFSMTRCAVGIAIGRR
jgi:hypothetical protein